MKSIFVSGRYLSESIFDMAICKYTGDWEPESSSIHTLKNTLHGITLDYNVI